MTKDKLTRLDVMVTEKVLDTNYVRPYTSCPAADYEVLKHVRQNWENELLSRFEKSLWVCWQFRLVTSDMAGFMAYEPGDYSRAALKALGEDV